jgi:hypothetical protein
MPARSLGVDLRQSAQSTNRAETPIRAPAFGA